MLIPSEFIEKVIKQFREDGFAAYSDSQPGVKTTNGLTLHQGIRRALGMRDDDSLYMYWEWKQLKTCLPAVWTAFDAAASKFEGRTTSAIASCSRLGFSANDLLSLIDLVDEKKLEVFPKAVRRPTKSESQVRFVGKRLGAILVTLGIAAEATDSGFGDLLSSMSQVAVDELQMLEQLDALVRREIGDPHQARPPSQVVILRALGWAYEEVNRARIEEDLPEFNFVEFLRETEASANWSGATDQDVLRRLLTIAPENADSSRKAIEKFLSN